MNGTGKTTTVGKLARVLVADGRTVVLGAADTFRAAAADQLQTWGSRVGVHTVRSDRDGADPAAVAFDAVRTGKADGIDVVLVDTAGRLQNKAGTDVHAPARTRRRGYYGHHIFFCLNERKNGEACCADHDAQAALRPLQGAGQGRRAWPARARCASTRPAASTAAPGGPVAVVYPEGVWYTYVDAQRHRRDRRIAPEERPGGRAPADAARTWAAEVNAQTESACELAGPAGRIEVLRDAARGRARVGTAVIAHPHPLFGGTMDNKVVQTLARAFVQARLDGGALQLPRRRRQRRRARRGPRRDRRHAGRGRSSVAPEGPLALAGFSFGAFVASSALQSLWSARDVRSDRAGGHGRRALRACRRCRRRRTTARWSSTASRTTRCRWPPCWTGRGRSHFRSRSCPGSSISFTDNCRC